MMTPNKHKSRGVIEDNFTNGHNSKYFVLSYQFIFAKTRPKYDIGYTPIHCIKLKVFVWHGGRGWDTV